MVSFPGLTFLTRVYTASFAFFEALWEVSTHERVMVFVPIYDSHSFQNISRGA